MSGLAMPRDCRDHGDLDATAAAFAGSEAVEAETMITALATEAIRSWRLDDATFWQRVKFRARLIRAARHGGPVTLHARGD